MSLSNGRLAELLARRAEDETVPHRRRALLRAARSAFFWPEEISDTAGSGKPLTEFRAVGPWVARILDGWLEDPPEELGPPAVRLGFLTLAEARDTVSSHPEWRSSLRADLQMHTAYSDGAVPLREMVEACDALRYGHIAITDHSAGLPIAGGMDEATMARQAEEIALVNRELGSAGASIRILHGIEMNLSPEGEGDVDAATLARLDLVLGAFHSKLRVREDQTGRYLAAVRNPTVDVLAHPRGRRFNARPGLQADWERVFEAAAESGTALEIDAHPDRQDLEVGLLEVARDAGVWISIGTDAHHPRELAHMEFGLAAAIRSGIPRERILNYLPTEALLGWIRDRRAARR